MDGDRLKRLVARFDWAVPAYDLSDTSAVDVILEEVGQRPISPETLNRVLPQKFVVRHADSVAVFWTYFRRLDDGSFRMAPFFCSDGNWVVAGRNSVHCGFASVLYDSLCVAVAQLLIRPVEVKYHQSVPGSVHSKVSARRERNGKPPVPLIRVISLSEVKKVYQRFGKSSGTGTHSSPMGHERSGHWRHFDINKTTKTGKHFTKEKVWINAFPVKGGRQSMIINRVVP
jgi:hypothetical protein